MSLPPLRPTLLDRYIVREIVPPTSLGLLLFTFIILLKEIPRLLETLISRSADLLTLLRVVLNLLPSIFAITIPMAFLLGVLLAFGRMASDSEIVALRASGISAARLLRPVLALSALTGLVTFYMTAVAVPNANQTYREILYSVVISHARTSVKPRVFNDDLIPGGRMLLYVSDVPAETGEWKDVFIHDLRNPQKPQLILARGGHLVIDRENKAVNLHLERGFIHSMEPGKPQEYVHQRFSVADFPLPFDEFFPTIPLAKGDRELTLLALDARIRELRREGKGPKDIARFVVEWHKRFSIPMACVVFGLLGLGLSLGSKKEARSAAFGLSIAVIFVYYVFIRLGEQAGDLGLISPWLAMWGANLVLGALAGLLLFLNHREAAFDPLDPSHYAVWLPRFRRSKGAPLRPLTRPPPVVVLRLPRLALRLPGVLDRYIAAAYLRHLLLVLVGFWAIFLLAEFLDLFDDVQQNRVKGAVVLRYFAYHSPAIAHLMIPMSILVAVLVTFGVLSRRNELTAMKAGGISVYRAVVPTLALAVLGSLALYGMGEFVLPPANRVAARDYNVIKGRPPQSTSFLERRWILGSDGRFYNYDYFQEGRGPGRISFFGLSVYDVNPKTWDLRDRLYASRAVWNGLAYELEGAWRWTFGGQDTFGPIPANARTREIDPPGYFKRERPESDTLRFGELHALIASLEALGLDVVRLRVQLHRKLAFPIVSVGMTLIGIPFSFVVARRGALYGIGISIVLAIVYWAFVETCQALGNNALLPPLLAAWAPNLLFGAAGLFLMLTLET